MKRDSARRRPRRRRRPRDRPGTGRRFRALVFSGHLGTAGKRGRRAAQLADVLGRLRQQAVQPSGPDSRGQRREPGAEVGLPDPDHRPRGDHAARRRRRDVHHRGAEQRGGRGRRHRRPLLALRPRAARRPAAVLRTQQPRRRHPRPDAVHEHAGRPPGGDRRRQRQPRLGRGGRRLPRGLQQDGRAAHRQGQGGDRHRRRRVRHPRLPRLVRRRVGRPGVAHLHHSGSRPSAQPDVGRRLVAHRRVAHLDHRLVRPRAQPRLLGHRQPRARLQRRDAPRRQPVLRLGARAGRRHRRAVLVLPVHAA